MNLLDQEIRIPASSQKRSRKNGTSAKAGKDFLSTQGILHSKPVHVDLEKVRKVRQLPDGRSIRTPKKIAAQEYRTSLGGTLMSANLLRQLGRKYALSGYWNSDLDLCIRSLLYIIEETAKAKGVKLNPANLYSKKGRAE